MRYYATLPGRPEPVVIELTEQKDGSTVASIEGQTTPVDVVILPSGALSVRSGNDSYDVQILEQNGTQEVLLRGHSFKIDVADERQRQRRAAAGKLAVEGRQVVTAPMPGKVVKVLVALGDDVQEGQGLVVVEAMKMENELKSPKAGKITELLAKEGTTVENNARLVVVD